MGKRSELPLLLRILLSLTRNLPPFWRVSGISNRIVKPFWCACGKRGLLELPIWGAIRMRVDPCEVVGGNLAFIPHLYDRWERVMLRQVLSADGIFVDVGSNIGAYALWAAQWVGEAGKVLALEADPDNFKLLQENIRLNQLDSTIIAVHAGVSDRHESLKLYRNDSCNKGGHSFIVKKSEDFVEISCSPLIDLVKASGIQRIDVMKLDVEGFEERILTQYFQDVPEESALRPRYLLVEINGGPITDLPARQRFKELLCAVGYVLVRDEENSLFKRISL